MNSYIAGHTIRLYCDFYSLAGVAADPTAVTLTLQDPAGAQTSYSLAGATVTKEAVGVYYREITVAAPAGLWLYRWEATGAVKAVEEGAYRVTLSRLS